MKKGVNLFVVLLIFSLVSPVNAASCQLGVKLINQDPYPALPGDYVKVVFQINGVANPECGIIQFEFLEKYPISFDPSENPVKTINAGGYSKDYSSFFLAPYKVRVDKDALEGESPIEVRYRYSSNTGYESTNFMLSIENTLAEFEVFVKEYNPLTKELTFEILNTAESDVKALTLEIPKQEGVEIQGANTNIVGDLDSNEYTTADFVGTLEEGDIKVNILYTDTINKRRTMEKVVHFDPSYFPIQNENGIPLTYKIIIFVLVVGIIYFFHRKRRLHNIHKK